MSAFNPANLVGGQPAPQPVESKPIPLPEFDTNDPALQESPEDERLLPSEIDDEFFIGEDSDDGVEGFADTPPDVLQGVLSYFYDIDGEEKETSLAAGGSGRLGEASKQLVPGEIELERAVIGGVYEGAILAPANLLDWALTEAAVNVASTITGKDRYQLEKENPALYTAKIRTVPDWLETETDLGGVINTFSQFLSGWGGVGALAKAAKINNIVGGASKAIKSAPLIGTAIQGLEAGAPTVIKTLQGIGRGLELSAKDFAVNTISFDAQEGNLANGLKELLPTEGPLAEDVQKWLDNFAVTKKDSELEGRLKNGLVSHLGEAGFAAAWGGLKILKNMKTVKQHLATGRDELGMLTAQVKGQIQKEVREAEETAAELATHSEGLQSGVDRELQGLFPGEVSINEEGFPERVSKISPENIQVVDYANETVNSTTKKVADAEEMFNAPGGLREQKRQELQNLIDRMATQAKFDPADYAQKLEAAVKSGQPVDIGEVLESSIPTEALSGVDGYKKVWPEVLQATTKGVKRFVSNAEQVERMVKMLATDLGDEAANKESMTVLEKLVSRGTAALSQAEELITLRLAADTLQKTVINPRLAKVGLALNDARKFKLTEQIPALEKELNDLLSANRTTKFLEEELSSLFGRGLQATQINPAGIDSLADRIFDRLRKDRPYLGQMEAAGPGYRRAWEQGLADVAEHTDLGGKLAGHWTDSVFKVLDAGGKTVTFTGQALQEIFYNSILSNPITWKAIAWSNGMIKGAELGGRVAAGPIVNTFFKSDIDATRQVLDEAEGLIRYLGEGTLTGLQVFAKNTPADLDYQEPLVGVISSEHIRSTFGSTLGDTLQKTMFEAPGRWADRAVDAIGSVIRIPTTRAIGGIDTIFKVANQRALLWMNLKQKAYDQGLAGREAIEYATQHIDQVTEDLIMARSLSSNFRTKGNLKEFTPKGVIPTDGLEGLHKQLSFETDRGTLNLPLTSSRTVTKGDGTKKVIGGHAYSDRWAFKVGRNINEAAAQFGIVGSWELPFVKTFVNSIQYGLDSSTLGLLSPYIRDGLAGKRGTYEQTRLLGQQIVAGSLGVLGIGAAQRGMLAPPAATVGAQKQNVNLRKENAYTLKYEIPGSKSYTILNFNRQSPIADSLFLPGHMWQLSQAYQKGSMSAGGALTAGSLILAQSFGAGRSVRGLSITLDTLLNPTYSTWDNSYRNLVVAGTGTFITPRALNLGKAFTDPFYRDFSSDRESLTGDVGSFFSSQTPGLSQNNSPAYDMFGNPRPADDYMGATNDIATNLVRGLTATGITYKPVSALNDELSRFGKLGNALTAPTKLLNVDGVPMPLDYFKDETSGLTLWDEYNRFLREYEPEDDGNTLQQVMEDFVSSEEYRTELKDDKVTHITGRRVQYKGSRWGELMLRYKLGKDYAKESILGDENLLKLYTNKDGKNILEVLEESKNIQEEAQ